jgi:hypothetical protein
MTPSGIDPATYRFVAQCLIHCATAYSNRNEYREYFLGVKGGRCMELVASTSWNPQGLSRLVMGLLYLYFPY